MSQFFFKMVEEMNEYCYYEEARSLYERFYVHDNMLKKNARKDLLIWIEATLDELVGIPDCVFRKMYIDEFKYNYDDCADKLLKHIYEFCEPGTWGDLCPDCDKHKPDVEFKTNLGTELDVYVCQDCYNKIESDE
tara:strand:- start:527 stop:931 length:405 start_codon:yes stop_codon:yes gene_type:complete